MFDYKQLNNGYAFNGDCLEVMDYLIKNNVKVDAIITDPPYQKNTGEMGFYYTP